MINFLHTFHPSHIIISLGPINLYWYGLFISLGIVVALLMALKLAKFYNVKEDLIWELVFWLLIFGFLGARIYHLLINWQYYLRTPLESFKIWHGGLAIHGAIFGGAIGLWLFTKKYKPPHQNFWCGGKLNFGQMADLLAPCLILAQAIGRWGNYFNQELFGRPTNLPWGIPIDPLNRPEGFGSFIYFHPTFLYESLLNLLICLVLLGFHYYKKNGIKINEGQIFLIYLILYSFVRFFLEFIRIDESYTIFNLRFAQVVSLLIVVISIIILIKQKPASIMIKPGIKS